MARGAERLRGCITDIDPDYLIWIIPAKGG
jgi:hypothetical protein